MARYRVQAPDGKILTLEGPDGATEQDIIAQAQRLYRPEQQKGSPLDAARDIPLALGQGATQGVRALTDVLGTQNVASQKLRDLEKLLGDLQSASAKGDREEMARIQQEAEGKGLGAQIGAAFKQLAVAPGMMLAQGVGSIAPTLAAAALTGGTSLEAQIAARAVQAGVGAAQGIGTIKGSVRDAVYQEFRDRGVPEEQAAAIADKAQSYSGGNLDQMLAGGFLGAVAGSTGIEKTIGNVVAKSLGKKLAEKTAEEGLLAAGAKGLVKEGLTEGGQGAQQQLAQNIALQREGVDVPTMRGVVTSGTLEGVVGGILGAGVDVTANVGEKRAAERRKVAVREATKFAQGVATNPTEENVAKAIERFKAVGASEEDARRALLLVFENAKAGKTTPNTVDPAAVPGGGQSGVPSAGGASGDGAVAGEPSGVGREGVGEPVATPVSTPEGEGGQPAALTAAPAPVGGPATMRAAMRPEEVVVSPEATMKERKAAAVQLVQQEAGAGEAPLTKKEIDTKANVVAREGAKKAKETPQVTEAPPVIAAPTAEVKPVEPAAPVKPAVPIAPVSDISAKLDAAYELGAKTKGKIAKKVYEAYTPEEQNAFDAGAGKRQVGPEVAIPKADFSLKTILPPGDARGVKSPEETVTKLPQKEVSRIGEAAMLAREALDTDEAKASFTEAVNGALGLSTPLLSSEVEEYGFEPRAYKQGLEFVRDQGGPDVTAEFYKRPEQIDYSARENLPATDRPLTDEDRRQIQWTKDLKAARNAQAINDEQYSRLLDLTASGVSNTKLRAELELAKTKSTGQTKPARDVVAYQRPADAVVSKDYPGGTLTYGTNPEFAARRQQIGNELRRRLSALGLKDVVLAVPDWLKDTSENGEVSVPGAYFKKIAYVALDGTDHFGTLNHEAVHAMRKLGLFTDTEWGALAKAAEDQWLAKYRIAERYGDQPKEQQIEEAVAEAYRDYAADMRTQKPGLLKRALDKIGDILRNVRNTFAKQGFDTPDKIFAAVERGDIGARKRAPQAVNTPSLDKTSKPASLNQAIRKLKADQKQTSEGVRKLQRSQESFYGSSDEFIKHVSDYLNNGFGAAVKGHDPTPVLKSDLARLPTKIFERVVNALPSRGLIDWARGAFGDDVGDSLGELQTLVERATGEKNRLRREYTKIAKKLDVFVNKHGQRELGQAYANRINRVDPTAWAKDATADQVVANDAVVKEYQRLLADKNTPEENKPRLEKGLELRKKQLSEAYTAWQKLGKQPGGHEIYKDIIEFYRTTYNDRRTALDNILRGLGLDEKATENLIASMKVEQERSRKDAKGNEGVEEHVDIDDSLFPEVYVPFNRYGKYWLRTAPYKGQSRAFDVFETAEERDAFRDKLAAERGLSKQDMLEGVYKDVGIDWGNEIDQLRSTFDTETAAMKEMLRILDKGLEEGKIDKDTMRDQLYQVLLMTTPERSIRRQYLHSDNVTGFSTDIKRGFNDSALRNANELANLRYKQQIDQKLNSLEEVREGMPMRERYDSIVKSLADRAKASVAPDQRSNLVDSINRVAFIYYLTGPATAITNMTSIPIRVMPNLAANYGYAKATAKIAKWAQIWKSVGVAKGEAFIPVSMETSKLVTQNAANKWAFSELLNHGAFEGASTSILRNRRTLAAGPERQAQQVGGFIYDAMTSLFNTSETLTRQAAAMMSFELEYEKLKKTGASEDAARQGGLKAALRTTNDTLGDYSEFERPPIMKGDLGRSLFLFKMYSVNQTRFFVTNLRKMVANRSPGDRVKAMNELSGVLLAGAMFHGLTGMPLYGLLCATLDLLHKVFDDDDERRKRAQDNPYTMNSADKRFRMDWLPKHFGEPTIQGTDGRMHTLANMLEYGPLSELTDLNFSSRTSFNGLWFREPQPSEDAQEMMTNIAIANVPFASMLVGAGRAVDNFNNGEIVRGLEALSPAFSRGALTAYRLNKEGAESLRGDKVVTRNELNDINIAAQILGIQPTIVADLQRETSMVKSEKYKLDQERSKLMGRFNKAFSDPEGTQDGVLQALQAIREHNSRYPDPAFQISQEQLEDSYRTFLRNSAMSYRGVTFTKKQAPAVLDAFNLTK